MVQCKQVREELSAFLDGELDIETRATVEEHLASCSNCLRALGGFKNVNDLYTALEPLRAPDTFEAELRKRIRPKPFAFLRTKRFVHWQLLPMTAAATALVAVSGIFILQQIKTAEQLQLASVKDAATPNEGPQRAVTSNGSENAMLPMSSALEEVATSVPQELPLETASGIIAPKEAPQHLTMTRVPATGSSPTVATMNANVQSTPPEQRVVKERTFVLSDGIWQEQPYHGEEPTRLPRDSQAYNMLAEQYPEIRDIADLGPKVIFRINETWYLLQP